jgi:hypothetical protein
VQAPSAIAFFRIRRLGATATAAGPTRADRSTAP